VRAGGLAGDGRPASAATKGFRIYNLTGKPPTVTRVDSVDEFAKGFIFEKAKAVLTAKYGQAWTEERSFRGSSTLKVPEGHLACPISSQSVTIDSPAARAATLRDFA
jgi:hypothetical protein